MKNQSQFQHLVLQKELQEHTTQTQQLFIVSPAINLPVRALVSVPGGSPLPTVPPAPPQQRTVSVVSQCEQELEEHVLTSRMPISEAHVPDLPTLEEEDNGTRPPLSRKKKVLRALAVILSLFLALILYFSWQVTNPPAGSVSPAITQQSISSPSASSTSTDNASTSSTIQVYILGAVKHPGVYTLPTDSRVYQLLQAAGGPLAAANLVALNLAAQLNDGQEIYVLTLGEVPPTYVNSFPGSGNTGNNSGGVTPGQHVNINTASVDVIRQGLHVSTATAQKIVDYRNQHGPYTSVDQLQQVVSQAIYARVKNLVTI